MKNNASEFSKKKCKWLLIKRAVIKDCLHGLKRLGTLAEQEFPGSIYLLTTDERHDTFRRPIYIIHNVVVILDMIRRLYMWQLQVYIDPTAQTNNSAHRSCTTNRASGRHHDFFIYCLGLTGPIDSRCRQDTRVQILFATVEQVTAAFSLSLKKKKKRRVTAAATSKVL